MATIPVIDLGALTSGSTNDEKKSIVDQLMRAATDVGFLQVANHGIPAGLVAKMFEQSAEFFALPLETKEKCVHDPSKNIGFESFSQIRPSTGLPDSKESLQLGFCGMEGKYPSTDDCPAFEATAKEFQLHCHQLAVKLLACFALGLGFPENFFEEVMTLDDGRNRDLGNGSKKLPFLQHHDVTQEDSQCTLRCLYYPPTGSDTPRGAWRAGSHTDFDTLTLLFQRLGQGGLEVCGGRQAVTDYGEGNKWTPVEPCENAVTINIGDLLMRWSDDVLKSNFHRVRMPNAEEAGKPRYSLAFFAQPNRSSLVQGLRKKYPPITAGEYVLQASRPQFEAKKLWADAAEDARRRGVQPGPIKVVTAQAASLA